MSTNTGPHEKEVDSAEALAKENRTLKRRLERITKEMKNLVALHDRAIKLRDYSEREKNLQYEYNVLLLENAPDMIFILDQEMRFRLGTRAFVRFLGREDSGTLADSQFHEIFGGVMPPAWIESTKDLFEGVVRERKQIQYNDEVCLDGERRIFSISVAPAVDSGGKVMGVLCLMHDSTELVLMKEAAEAATQAKSSFLAGMSHEIRTPMNAIKGLSELMARTPLSNQQKVYIDNIVKSTSSLLIIINDILDFSKIEANRYEIVKTDYGTTSELGEICGLMHPKAVEKNIYFVTDFDPDLPSILIGDNLRIRQILINIINNAIKFTNSGGIVFSVQGEHLRSDEWLITYRVKDSGQGIKTEELPKIFQAFEQADFYKNRNISGTGLGLAISRNLAELMGGDISAESEYGAGSVFTIRIPQTSIGKQRIASIENPNDKRLLLFHLNPEILTHLGRSIEKLGIPYKNVSSARELRAEAQRADPTHVLIDEDLSLTREITKAFPNVSAGCMRSLADLGDVTERIRILFKPVSVTSVAAFINGIEEGRGRIGGDTGKLGSVSFEGARVLIVDDNEINLVVASEMLKTYNIVPETALSGAEALEMAGQKNYDMIFMDHMMPGMDGIEATTAIRAMSIPQPAIVALTANAMLGMEEMYKKSGFDAYITKPIDVDSLNSALLKYLHPKE